LAPKPPPTSGVITPVVGHQPVTGQSVSRAPCAPCVLSHWYNRVDHRRGHPCNGGTAWLDRARCDALVDEPAGDDDRTVGEVLVAGVVGHAERRRVEHHIAAGTLEDQGARLHRLFRVDQGLQHVVVDDDLFGSVAPC
jgi:hypothetical protein